MISQIAINRENKTAELAKKADMIRSAQLEIAVLNRFLGSGRRMIRERIERSQQIILSHGYSQS